MGSTAESHRIRLQKVIPEPVEPEEKLYRLNINSFIEAEFRDLVAFLFEMENKTGIFRIHKIEIEAPGEHQSRLQVRLQLSSYLR